MRNRRGELHCSVNNTQLITAGLAQRWIRYAGSAVIFFIALLSASCADKPPAPSASAPIHDTAIVPAASAAPHSVPTISCDEQVDAQDRSICPGQRVGAVMPGMTRNDLRRIYGTQSVRDDSVYLGEGEWGRGIAIKASATDSLMVTLIEDSLIGTVFIRSAGWRTEEGLGVGSALTDLTRVYKTVRVFGFGFDGAGAVMLPDSVTGIWFRVYPTEPRQQHAEAWSKVVTGDDYPADHASLQILKPAVTEIRVTFRSPWDSN